MRIDRSRIKKSTSEVPAECQVLIEKLRSCSRKELLEELKRIDTWTFGKCELYHWIDILDLCDSILEAAATHATPKSWQLSCDIPENHELKELLLWVLHFTTLLIEHSFSRHLYNSVEHLLTLLSSSDLNVVLGVLNLLYMFSKRSNFITRINPEMRSTLLKCLTYLAESWGGRENGFGLADCVREYAVFPSSATTLHYEFYTEDKSSTSQASCIHLENVDQLNTSPSEIMDGLIEIFHVPKDGQMMLFTHLRLAYSFSDHAMRLKCVQARLQALSVLLYSNADSHNLLYPGILDELVELLELNIGGLVDIRSAALRTLTSIIHLDRSPHIPKKPGSRLNMIIEVTGAGLYHGFLPTLVRSCITSLTSDGSQNTKETEVEQFPLPLATALFSFLYHLASYEAGGEALVSCGMMECLLRVINWPGLELEHITFVTRAVRVIDLITNIDMQSFQSHAGICCFINRLEMEMTFCKQDHPWVAISATERRYLHLGDQLPDTMPAPSSPQNPEESSTDEEAVRIAIDRVAVDSDSNPSCSRDQIVSDSVFTKNLESSPSRFTKTCLPQRAALLKSMLNFLKKALQDPAFTESIRHVMEGTLPSSLKHIISNAEYYGPSLFLLATDVVAVYVFQEPSLLSSLQDVGLTDVVLHALLVKNVPATREVLGSVPNVFSALCLNARGLSSFVQMKPFEKLFKVLLSPNYLSAMRRRRSSDPIGDTASNLGNAMDELMRHQPSLKSEAISAIIKLLQELCQLGRDPKYVCWKPQKGSAEWPQPAPRVSNEAGSSDEEEEDEEEASTSSHPQSTEASVDNTTAFSEKTPIALVDYILNVMKFVDAILSNNSTDDHCREFVSQNGLVPLLSILGLPNLPVDYTITPAAQAVASVCKSVLNLAHEPLVMKQGLTQLSEVLVKLQPLYSPHTSRGSLLIDELSKAPCIETAFSTPSATPLLHAMAAVHGYVIMFVHVCRTGQLDIRTISMTHWGSELGLKVLSLLSDLYISLVWESTLLLAVCSEDLSSREFKEDVAKIYLTSMSKSQEAMDISGNETSNENMEVDDDRLGLKAPQIPNNVKLKYLKPLLGASSRLGRALAELFGLLVKLSVGFPVRTRRGNHTTNTPVSPTPSAHAVANSLACLLAQGLDHKFLTNTNVVKFKLTYLICSVGFTQPMLFDDKKYPYHLMLQKFVTSKGQAAFFETFRWALTANGKYPIDEGISRELPEGTDEFLEAWLLLLEKMVNPKAILESNHMLPNRVSLVGKQFDPLKYLLQVHKLAFDALSNIWGRKGLPKHGARLIETVLLIYRHLLKGEKIIDEKYAKEGETSVFSNSSSSGGGSSSESRRGASGREHRPDVNPTELSQLMDMGFSRDHCYEALILTASLEHATDYLLNNFFPHTVQATPPVVDLEEQDELDEVEGTIDKSGMDEFCNYLLKTCQEYIQDLPELVYRVSEVMVSAIRRNGERFANNMIFNLISTVGGISSKISEVVRDVENGKKPSYCFDPKTPIPTDVYTALIQCPYCEHLSANIHLFMLLFEEVKVPCAKTLMDMSTLSCLMELLETVSKYVDGGPATPKWLAPLLLMIDLLEKVTVFVNRKVKMHKVTTQVWRWLDLASGKWSLYMPNNNKIINDAYWRGDRDVTINSGRRRYTIHFVPMIQINDDSGKARPVMMTLIDSKDKPTRNNYDHPPKDVPPPPSVLSHLENNEPIDPVDNLSDPEYSVDYFHRRVNLTPLARIKPEYIETVLRSCMTLISKPADPDTLHAVLNVCVRFTRVYDNARLVAEAGAVNRLLKLTQASHFVGFVGLATMLIRHILEEPGNITAAIERVIRFKTLPNIPPTFKELHYILRECAPAICRNPQIFKEVAKSIMRVDISVLTKRGEEDDPRLLMKCLPGDPQKEKFREVDKLVKETITQLLDFIVEADMEEDAVYQLEEPETFNNPSSKEGAATTEENNAPSSSRNDQEPDLDSINSSNLPMYIAATGPATSSYSAPKKQQSSSTSCERHSWQLDRKKKLPLLTISNVLKILADAVRSYTCIAKMITDHKYSQKQHTALKEDCSAVAFVLDYVMPVKETTMHVWDHDRPSMARNLIAALASCNHSPDAQGALVTEVKAALGRALALPESSRKHTSIQDLVGVVTTMIENCPPVPISSTPLSPAIKLNQYSVNNMVKFMMKKGIITDLARIPHSLDLSSPKMAATINAALKPLETLSRIMSQPSGANTSPTKLKAKPRDSSAPGLQLEQSGAAAGDDENADVIDDQPEILSGMREMRDVMNRVVETVNDMEELIQDVITPRSPRRGHSLRGLSSQRRRRPARGGQQRRRFQGDLSRFSSVFNSSGDLNSFVNNEETSQDSSSDDSDSNPSEEERHMNEGNTSDIDDQEDDEEEEDEDEDDEDDDDDDDDDDEVEGEDNDGDESNGGYDEEGLELFEPEEGLFRIPGLERDSDDFLMIEYTDQDTNASIGSAWTRDPFIPWSELMGESSNVNNDSSGTFRIPTHHPLLSNRQPADPPANTSNTRTQRMNRARRYQYVQMNSRATVATPVFLQRLMSQNASDSPNYLNIPGHPSNTYGEVLASTFPNTRLIVMDNGLGILTNAEEEQINFVDQSGYLLGPSLAATLTNVPTSMHWWHEELRLLDRDSVCDCAIFLGYELAPYFERLRSQEFAERKHKRKKEEEEENNKKTAGESAKKKIYDGLMDLFETSEEPSWPRQAVIEAAQQVAQATETLADSIVDSVLHPQPQGDVASGTEMSDPLGLIPGSVPYSPLPDRPDDGFFRPIGTEHTLGSVPVDMSSSSSNPQPPTRILITAPNSQALAALTSNLRGTAVEIEMASNWIQSQFQSQPTPELPDMDVRDGINPGDAGLTASQSQSENSQTVQPPAQEPPPRDTESSTPLSDPTSPPLTPQINPSGNLDDLSEIQFPPELGQNNIFLPEETRRRYQPPLGFVIRNPAPPPLRLMPPPSCRVEEPSDNSAPGAQDFFQAEDMIPPPPPLVHISRLSAPGQLEETSPPTEPPSDSGSATGTAVLSDDVPAAVDIPEGVDPSFLAALPEEMRAEVLSEHLRQQRLQTRIQQNQLSQGVSSEDGSLSSSQGLEVNPDFLAALPPNIQEEVLAQQRLEQQRQAAALSNPNDPVDAAAFFQDMPSSLRQAILTDMEESQISVLPPELAAEAQNLRREWEARNRQLMQERFLSHVTHNSSALSSILRHSGGSRNIRRPGLRYTIQNMGPASRTRWLSSWNTGLLDHPTPNSGSSSSVSNSNLTNAGIMGRPRGRQVLDYESICCLLVLLFVDDSRLNTARLHRVFRNLCYHPQTKDWVIKAILSIMEKSNEGVEQMNSGTSGGRGGARGNTVLRRVTRSQSQSSPEPSPLLANTLQGSQLLASSANNSRSGSSWLNISMDAALGCRATVFHVHKNPGRRNDKTITINPQAAPFVYRHTLEILISLARNFPNYFVPGKLGVVGNTSGTAASTTASKAPKSTRTDNSSSFWDLLIRLDSLGSSKKGKAVTRPSTANLPVDMESLCMESSPFGQLLKMLASPVVYRSSLLMDKLLRLLSLISISLQVHRQRLWDKVEVNEATLHHLGLAIKVLTSNTCSEEGLEDATALLLNMTVNLANTRETVLSMLLDAARNMALTVCEHIKQLLRELRKLNSQHAQHEDLDDANVDSKITSLKGILSNRFTKDTVVVTAPKKVKAGLDLQLNSMAPLISKTSSQAFFLRILKVIVQLRESVRNFDKKKKKQAGSVGSGEGTNTTEEGSSTTATASQEAPPSQESTASTQESGETAIFSDEPMDTSTSENNTQPEEDTASKLSEEQPLPPLSEQLDLDILWDTLSQCLTELQHTQDNHAVLVLQPAVEAFFLVHASGMEKPDNNERTERVVSERGDRERSGSAGQQGLGLDGLAPAPPPVSPLPSDPSSDPAQPSTSSNYSFPISSASTSETANLPPHQLKFLKFAETHRTVLNQILRQCTTPLLEGPFAVLVNHTRVLDFDVKRRYFRSELERLDEGHRREELAVHVRRNQVFEDSFRELHRKPPDDWKNRFYIVFEGEEGQDAGGLLREWYMIISREIFNPMYALFTTSPGDRVTYMINPSSHCNPNHLFYFKFVGRVIAKAIYDNKLLECYFTRSFYKHILGILVKYTDMESEDYSFYQGLVYLMENHVDSLGYELTFSTEVQEFGVTDVRDLISNGRNLVVTEENKMEYIRLVCQMKMTGAIRKQLNAFLEGFYDIIPMRLISIFNEQELELLISGLPNVDIEDLKANTEYYKYQPNSLQIQWFWRALREFDQAERAKFLQFVTGTSKVPLQGFAALEGMNGVQKFQIHRDERSTDRLPSAHTCFNQLDLPVYETYTKLRTNLLKAIHECSEGFGFA